MNTEKTGKYIAQRRKRLGMTQAQLAEKLGMSDKSVSKWERGVCLPDVSVYQELCEILGISLNEFFAGEDLERERIVKQSEENLMQAARDHALSRKKWIRGLLALLAALFLVTGVFLWILYRQNGRAENYLRPAGKESDQMQTAELFSDEDGVFLYEYAMEEGFDTMTVSVSVYEQGELVGKENVCALSGENGEREGVIAILPDFGEFLVRMYVADESTKCKGELEILKDVENRQYFGRSASEMDGEIFPEKGHETGFLALLYDDDGLSVIPMDAFEEGDEKLLSRNDYMYYFSVLFQ